MFQFSPILNVLSSSPGSITDCPYGHGRSLDDLNLFSHPKSESIMPLTGLLRWPYEITQWPGGPTKAGQGCCCWGGTHFIPCNLVHCQPTSWTQQSCAWPILLHRHKGTTRIKVGVGVGMVKGTVTGQFRVCREWQPCARPGTETGLHVPTVGRPYHSPCNS